MCKVTTEVPLKNAGNSPKKRPSSPILRTLIYKKQWEEVERVLKDSPSQARSADKMGDLPLHEACLQGAPFNVVKNLLVAYPDSIKQKGFCGRLALHYAAYVKPSLHIIKLLIQRYPEGAAVFDADGRLPLHLAVIRNAPKQAIETLICAYPKGLKTANRFGSTPLMLARNNQMSDLLRREQNQPRNVQKKIDVEKNMLSVWGPSRQSPVAMNDTERNADLLGLGITYPKIQKNQSQKTQGRKVVKQESKKASSHNGTHVQPSTKKKPHTNYVRKPLHTKRTFIPSPSSSINEGYNPRPSNDSTPQKMKVPQKIVLKPVPHSGGFQNKMASTSSLKSTFTIESPRGPLDIKAHSTMQSQLLALEQSWR